MEPSERIRNEKKHSQITPMPNTELTRLMELSAIHSDDRPEVERIFACLTEERRMAVLSDWPRMAERIKRNPEAVEEQKRLLLANAVTNALPKTFPHTTTASSPGTRSADSKNSVTKIRRTQNKKRIPKFIHAP